MIRGLDERSRSIIARRNLFGLSTTGNSADIPTGWNFIPGWPQMQININASGSCWTMFGGIVDLSLGSDALVGIGIDSATPPPGNQVGFTAVSTHGNAYASLFAGITGLTPGFHLFELWAKNTAGSGTAHVFQPFMIVWPQ
jgi:hypothetical protein